MLELKKKRAYNKCSTKAIEKNLKNVKKTKNMQKLFNLQVDWVTAVQECEKQMMVLISIRSEEENKALAQFLRPRTIAAWIGGYNYGDDDQWRWIEDGNVFNYTNWATNAPTEKSKSCAQIIRVPYGKWLDEPCNVKKKFVCELVKKNCSQ